MKKTKIAGATFNGKVTFNGPMYHIHDNGSITRVNGKDMEVIRLGHGQYWAKVTEFGALAIISD